VTTAQSPDERPDSARSGALSGVSPGGGFAEQLRRLAQSSNLDPMFMGWCTLGSTFAAETVGRSGADVVCLDAEHGLMGWDAALATVMTLSAGQIPVVVRVSSPEPAETMKALDAGADGVVVPHVENAQEAAHATDACRYPPQGHRSWGPTRASLLSSLTTNEVNDQIACIVMLESVEAIRNATEIAATQNINGILVGSNDLCLDLATPDRSRNAVRRSSEFRDLLTQVATACREAGIPAAAPASNFDEAAMLVELGYKLIVLPSDAALLRAAVQREVGFHRSSQQSKAAATPAENSY
jgi:4-hydroxy-2-oxoheptanedioate aldolase